MSIHLGTPTVQYVVLDHRLLSFVFGPMTAVYCTVLHLYVLFAGINCNVIFI
jgi:hypothetical protein